MAQVIPKGMTYSGSHLSRKICLLSMKFPLHGQILLVMQTYIRRYETTGIRKKRERPDAERASIFRRVVTLVPRVEETRGRVGSHCDQEGGEISRPGAGEREATQEDTSDDDQDQRRGQVQSPFTKSIRGVSGNQHGERAARKGCYGEEVGFDNAESESPDDLGQKIRGHLQDG